MMDPAHYVSEYDLAPPESSVVRSAAARLA
jgi:hypothetical protein